MSNQECNPDSIPIIQGMGKCADGPNVTTLLSKEMPKTLRDTLATIITNDPDLWYIQTMEKSRNEILVFRGNHP